MKSILVTLFFSLLTTVSYSQIQAVLKDSKSKEPIAYVNVWIEGEKVGTSSDEKGYFELPKQKGLKNLVFSAVGYETKTVSTENLASVIYLQKQVTELGEIEIIGSKGSRKKVLGRYSRKNVTYGYSCGKTPLMIARLFPFEKKYKKTPFLSKINLLTHSIVNRSKFIVRFYRKNKDGGIGEFLYDEPVYGIAEKKKRLTTVDLKEYNIQFPKEGLYIVLEWLIIEGNKYEQEYKRNGVVRVAEGYTPIFSLVRSNSSNTRIYTEGKWQPALLNNDINPSEKKYRKGRFSQVAMELTLSN